MNIKAAEADADAEAEAAAAMSPDYEYASVADEIVIHHLRRWCPCNTGASTAVYEPFSELKTMRCMKVI
jgi:hypothetical protein